MTAGASTTISCATMTEQTKEQAFELLRAFLRNDEETRATPHCGAGSICFSRYRSMDLSGSHFWNVERLRFASSASPYRRR